MSDQNGKDQGKNRSSQSSINSNPELKEKKIYFLRISLILINIISFISGFYIFKNKDFYLSEDYKFEYSNSLYIFLILYSLGMIGTLIVSFLLSILIKIIILIVYLFSDTQKPLIKAEEKHSESSIRFINSHANEFSIIPYTFTFFVVITSVIYLLSLPYSIYLLIFISKNEYYTNTREFAVLYFFIIINLIAGLILFYVLLVIVFAKRNGSFRQNSFFIDDNNLNNLRNEIRGAMQRAEN